MFNLESKKEFYAARKELVKAVWDKEQAVYEELDKLEALAIQKTQEEIATILSDAPIESQALGIKFALQRLVTESYSLRDSWTEIQTLPNL